ncbi:MAG: radical SAM protein [Candidatus Woesearchaeota archaeon]
MGNLKSLSLFVGTGDCNANCKHCAGKPLRKYAPKEDGIIDEALIGNTLKNCYQQGARSLSISSSGEPTLSPIAITKTLDLIHGEKGIEYSWANIYSNGIRIGKEKGFSEEYLPLWKSLGLKTVYITVHDVDEKKNAKIYRVKEYPSLNKIVYRIHNSGLLTRANVVLTKNNVATCKKFVSMIQDLRNIGFDHISAWPIRNLEDKLDLELAPTKKELDKMENWVNENQNPEYRLRLLREKSRALYNTGQKLTLFPDGSLSSTWC